MKTKLYFFLWVCLCIPVACEDKEPDTSIGNRTVLVYIAADNSLASFASQDLAEMKVGMTKAYANVHLLVYIDDGKISSFA